MRVQLVTNPHSRRGKESAPAVAAALREAGVDVVETELGSNARPEVDAIVGAGGDGTLVALIGDAIARDLPLGLIPLGTFNELARTLGVPLDIEAAAAVIASGTTSTIDVGRVNGVYFLNEASIGISSRITRLQTPELKQRWGVLGVIGTALHAFKHSRAMHVTVEHDNGRERLRTVQVTIANSHRFGGVFNVEDAAIDDGWLDLYSVQIDSVAHAFHVARAALRGRREEVPGLRTIRSRQFRLTAKSRHHITADGEEAGKTPATFEVLPAALRVFTQDAI